MDKNYEYYVKTKDLLSKYSYVTSILSFDENTVCPKDDKKYSFEVIDFFSEKILNIIKSNEYYDNLKYLKDHKKLLSKIEFMDISKKLEDLDKERKIPLDLAIKGNKIISDASVSWEEARETLDYSIFEENLTKLVSYYKEVICCKEDKLKGYDILLDDMEDNMTIEKYDEFFSLLEVKVLPLLKKILTMPKKYNSKLDKLKFDISKQKLITNDIVQMMGYTNKNGYLGETIHPFTSGINANDVRTTTNYKEELLFSNIFSVMHEVGHALYELQIDKKYNNTALFGGTSCAIHESQSRFYENYLGRKREFIEFLFPILKKYYEKELKDITVDDIYYYVNDVSSNLIRIEADELSYPFHILIRYKIEKGLFDNTIEVKDIDKTFNYYMKEYFNIVPKNKKEGCYQDVHWSSGFGYFPTYALGSAISAQIYYHMSKELDIDTLMSEGNFKPINKYLKNKIHKYGASVKNFDLIHQAFNEDFNPNYYVDYLINKFKKIYDLED